MMMNETHSSTSHVLKSLAIAFVALLSSACGMSSSGDPEVGAPEADFSENATRGGPGLEVRFTNESSGDIDSYEWDFGAAGTSEERNPTVRFDEVGVYTVELRVSGPEGRSRLEKPALIEVFEADESDIADFTVDATEGTPGTTFQFTDTSTSPPTSWSWEIRDEDDLVVGTSTEQNPSFTLTELGAYDVTLSITSPAGDSTLTRRDFVAVFDETIAAFSCTPEEIAFSPVTRTCTNESTNAKVLEWEFGELRSCYHVLDLTFAYTPPGGFDRCGTADPSQTFTVADGATTVAEDEITLRAIGGGSQDTATLSVRTSFFYIDPNVASGADAPVTVRFRARDADGLDAMNHVWTVEPQFDTFLGHPFEVELRQAGTYTVVVSANGPFSGLPLATLEYTVGYGVPEAALAVVDTNSGLGPFTVEFDDLSTGEITTWLWDFGDGSSCFHTTDAEIIAPDGVPPCGSNEPSHTYVEAGWYDVRLTVEGPESAESNTLVSDEFLLENAVQVTIADPSFEAQAAGVEIALPWIPVRPESPTEAGTHRGLGTGAEDSTDLGMPTDGDRWTILDGRGTDGALPVDETENGIRQTIYMNVNRPVLEFDYVFLYIEPPGGVALDAIAATVSDGTDTVLVPTSVADTGTPFVGESTLFPTSEGRPLRGTPVLTASINLADAFPTADPFTEFELTIRVGNADNANRSPFAYVDNLRFSRAATDTLPAEFELTTDPVFVGAPAQFFDLTCTDEADDCDPPTSWLWDFDTQDLLNLPDATGSGEQHPVYTFEEAGIYNVQMTARRADLEETAILDVTVIENPVASFEVTSTEPFVANAPIEFLDTSVVDPLDPIASWEWDFDGWGTSTDQDPGPIEFGAVETVTVTLVITTVSGVESEAELMLDIVAP